MSFDASTVYSLLPAIYRIRDASQGEQLKALIGVLAEQVAVLEEDLEQLYDDQFIETCADWVVPYIGDLVGYRPLHGVVPTALRARAEVANTIQMRRRKGTAAMLEQLARDATGWHARVVEYFQWLGWNQYMQHLRIEPPRGGTLNLRDHDACERILHAEGAFDSSARTIDVRRISSSNPGRHNIRNVGLFLWRLRPYAVTNADACEVGARRYTFNPLGLDAPLFNRPRTEADVTHLAEEINVPGPLRRRPLYDELEAIRAEDPATPVNPLYFGESPVLAVMLNDDLEPVPPKELQICDLTEWHEPKSPARVAVDPVLGRLTVRAEEAVGALRVSYVYGFSDDMGAGPYDRTQSVNAALTRPVQWQIGVSREAPEVPHEIVRTLREAVAEWNAQPPGTLGVISILDSRTYAENLTGEDRITIPPGSRLLIVAADWPKMPVAETPGAEARIRGHLAPDKVRPVLRGDISVVGSAGSGETPGALIVNGLLMEGTITVLVGNLGALELVHGTIVPGRGEIIVNASATDPAKQNAQLALTLDHSICGSISMPAVRARVRILNSIVSNGDEDYTDPAIDATQAVLDVERSTMLGSTRAGALEARNALFLRKVETVRRQMGCVSFSYLPPDSRVPRRYRCQPDLEIATRIQAEEKAAGTKLSQAARDAIRTQVAATLVPAFTSIRYGQPGYGQLRNSAPVQIRTGADDEAEMGAFHDLYQPQRETNLRVRLDEYLRFGLDAGVFCVT